MTINPLTGAYASPYVSESSRKRKSNDPWDALTEHQRREAAANRDRLGLDQLEANSMAARARVQNAEAPAAAEADDAAQGAKTDYHWQTFAGKSIPSSDAPDYSTWDKEDAYCDIIERYNLLNLLTPEKARELGLSEEYGQMKAEINDLLYGGNPFALGLPSEEMRALDSDLPQRMNRKVYKEMYRITSDVEYEQRIKKDIASMFDADNFGAWGINSSSVQIYQKLSQFDLTDNKKNLTGTMPRHALAPSPSFTSPFNGMDANEVDIFEYYDYVEQHLLQQVERAGLPRGQYTTYKAWTTLMREMYTLCLAEGASLGGQ
jgi:hypothetical protein